MTTTAEAEQSAETSTALVEFSELAGGLAEMARTLEGVVFDLTKARDDKAARQARAQLKAARNRIEERRLALNKADRALIDDRIVKRNEAADLLKGKVSALEGPLDEAIKADEARREAERLEAERIEAERVAAIQRRIDDIRDLAVNAVDSTSADILQCAVNLKSLRIEAGEFQELLPAAVTARDQVMTRLHELHGKAQHAEQQAKRLKEAEEQLAEARRIEAERQKREQAEQAAEQARQAEANRVERERLAQQQADLERKEAEAAERRRREDQEASDRRAAADKEANERRSKADAEARALQEGLSKIRHIQASTHIPVDASLTMFDAAIEMVDEFDHLNELPLELCDEGLRAKEAALATLRNGRALRAADIEAAEQRQRGETAREQQRIAEEAARTAGQKRLHDAAGAMFDLLEQFILNGNLTGALRKRAEALVRKIKGAEAA